MFSKDVVITTTVLENGINIKDHQLKHIVIDLTDMETIVQCIGRKRLFGNDGVNLYVRIPTRQKLVLEQTSIDESLKIIQDYNRLHIVDFWLIYCRDDLKGIVYVDGYKEEEDKRLCISRINEIKRHKLEAKKSFIKRILKDGPAAFLYSLSNHLYLDYVDGEFTQIYLDPKYKTKIEAKLEALTNIQLFDKEKRKIAEAIQITPFSTFKHKVSLNHYNTYFKEEGFPFTVENFRCTSGENRNKSYWILKKNGSS